MGDIAVRVDKLSKRYSIGRGDTPLQVRAIHALGRMKRKLLSQPIPDIYTRSSRDASQIWALRDVCFELKKGDAVGIIGRNGAGKSTLLKILARITKPTEGYAEIHGRLGALLEVGTGFHPELTGRENIFMNAAILGLTKAETKRRFDDIVAFADVEKFIDTPIKHYSTGMFMRLAFSVSAHLDPDILVLDEVLAVGDASFQKKCLGQMEGAKREGRTVIFVSHSIPSVVAFCNRAMLFEEGKLVMDGTAVEVTEAYQAGLYSDAMNSEDLNDKAHYGNGKARFTSLSVIPLDTEGNEQPVLRVGHDLQVEVMIVAREEIMEANVAIIIYTQAGHRVVDANIALADECLTLDPGQKAKVTFRLRNVLLKPDTYLLGLWMGRRNVDDIDGITYARPFTVEIDPSETKHFQIFPGVYQCRYTCATEVAPLT